MPQAVGRKPLGFEQNRLRGLSGLRGLRGLLGLLHTWEAHFVSRGGAGDALEGTEGAQRPADYHPQPNRPGDAGGRAGEGRRRGGADT